MRLTPAYVVSNGELTRDLRVEWREKFDDVDQVCGLYVRSGLLRPHHDPARVRKILSNSNAFVTAFAAKELVGFARGLSDQAHISYLADLAVDPLFQRAGLGRLLVQHFLAGVGDEVSVVVHAATGASGFYTKVGFELWENVFRRTRLL